MRRHSARHEANESTEKEVLLAGFLGMLLGISWNNKPRGKAEEGSLSISIPSLMLLCLCLGTLAWIEEGIFGDMAFGKIERHFSQFLTVSPRQRRKMMNVGITVVPGGLPFDLNSHIQTTVVSEETKVRV